MEVSKDSSPGWETPISNNSQADENENLQIDSPPPSASGNNNTLKFSVESLLTKKEFIADGQRSTRVNSPTNSSSSSHEEEGVETQTRSSLDASCLTSYQFRSSNDHSIVPSHLMTGSGVRIPNWPPDHLRYLPPFPFLGWIRGNNGPLSPSSAMSESIA